MKLLQLLQLITATVTAVSATPTFVHMRKRIVDGAPVPEKLSWLASIQYEGGSHFCGGSMVRQDMVVTAAHCVAGKSMDELSKMTVSANRYDLAKSAQEEGGVDFDIIEFAVHSQFDSKSLANDIAMLRVQPRAGFEQNLQNIRPIPLDQKQAGVFQAMLLKKRAVNAAAAIENTGIDPNSVPADQLGNVLDKVQQVQGVDTRQPINNKLFVAGWGVQDESGSRPSQTVLRAAMKVAQSSRCQNDLGLDAGLFRDGSYVCALGANFNSDTCQGDSGGPLYTDDGQQQTLVGITSFGSGCSRHAQAQDADGQTVQLQIPGVYVQPGFFQQFIQSYLHMAPLP